MAVVEVSRTAISCMLRSKAAGALGVSSAIVAYNSNIKIAIFIVITTAIVLATVTAIVIAKVKLIATATVIPRSVP